MLILKIFALSLFFVSAPLSAAVSCTLDHPDQGIKRLFPESTGYRVRDLIPERTGPKDLFQKLKQALGRDLDKEYVTLDTPYTFYSAYKGDKYIGLALGINNRSPSGLQQIFVAYEPSGAVRDVYVQKIDSPDASAFRSRFYRQQFRKFSINKILDAAYVRPPVRMPGPSTLKDHHSFVDGVRLNLLLIKHFYNAQSKSEVPEWH